MTRPGTAFRASLLFVGDPVADDRMIGGLLAEASLSSMKTPLIAYPSGYHLLREIRRGYAAAPESWQFFAVVALSMAALQADTRG